MCPTGKTIDDATIIGGQEGGLYKLEGTTRTSLLVHDSMEPSELWYRRLAHVDYIALPIASKTVLGLPEIQMNHEGICKGCAQGKNM